MRTTRCALVTAGTLGLFACAPDAADVTFAIQAHSFAQSDWSAPVNVGPPVNSTANELQPAVSPDGLSLYFASNRPGGVGGNDIWVARRDCDRCPWGEPVNLTMLNTSAIDGGPAFSNDGHLLFFHSGRPGGPGNNDLYVSRRANPKDDFGWEPPTVLDAGVNTTVLENKPAYLENAEEGAYNLYFNRGPNAMQLNDIYVVAVTRDGATTRAPVVPVAELNDPIATDAGAHLRGDGREIFFQSDRTPTLGLSDLWTSTRRSVHDPWSPPAHLPGLSSEGADRHVVLSDQGRTLIFSSNRAGGGGGDDLWVATRTPSGR